MGCAPTYHETELRSLFGSAVTPSFTEKICAPDSSNCGDFSFECAIETYKTVKGGDLAMATLESVGKVTSFYATGGVSVLSDILTGVAVAEGDPNIYKAGQAIGLANKVYSLDINPEATMGLFDSFDFDFGSVVDFTGDMIDNFSVSEFTDLANTGFQAYNLANTGGGVQTIPVMAKAPAVVGAIGGAVARSGAVVGRSFFNKWPNLATAIQKMKNAGQNVSRSKLYSMLKRFGPEFLVTAGIMSAAAVSELALAGPGHRRMNPANSKALRRAQRRLKSFHRLCVHTDALKPRKRRC